MNENIFENIKLFLLDMDGTLYLDDRLFDFTTELLEKIKQNGSRYLFVTNNSSKSVSAYVEKLGRLGIKAVHDDFMTASQATVFYLQNNHPSSRLYVCGTNSLKQELENSGFFVTENLDEVDAVVIGNDTELTFKKLDDVCRLLTKRDLPYIATNPDYVCPTEYGFVPDCGSFCDMIYNAVKKRPVVIGKPFALMPQLAMNKFGVTPKETAVIGDRIYTDIKSGLNAGCVTVLVLSGETTKEILCESQEKPDFVFENAGEIMKYLH